MRQRGIVPSRRAAVHLIALTAIAALLSLLAASMPVYAQGLEQGPALDPMIYRFNLAWLGFQPMQL